MSDRDPFEEFMVAIVFVSHDGSSEVAIDAPVGGSLMLAATANRVEGIEAACGGSMVCGTCHVYVDPEWLERLPAPSDAEAEIIEYGVDPQWNSRLSCQIMVEDALDGMRVTTPASQR
jgi:2Fe-2S ferredoxin